MGEWREVKFQDLCRITRGASPRPIHDFLGEDGIPWVKISDATASGTRFIESTKEYIKIEGKSKSVSVYRGDLILSNSATPGIPKFMRIDACVHDGWLLLREFSGLLKEFAYYLLINEKAKLVNSANGSVFNNLKTEILKNHVVRIPSVLTQQKISSILSSLDDKIELNRKMNETLEEMARAIFKSWFVDFDPVHAKARGEKPAGMPDEIADLFPSEFVHSDQLNKPIPKGWSVKPLGDIFNLTMGQSPPGDTYNQEGEGVPFYQGRTDFGFRFPTRRIYCKAPKRIAEQFDILVSVRAPVGDINVANEKCCIGRGLAALKHKSGSFSYSCYAMKDLESVFKSYESGGTVFGSINQKEFSRLKLLEPSSKLVKSFENFVSSMDEKIFYNSQEIATLQEQRDSLLPKLISGEIEV